jgi:prephenate dehydratase
MRVGFLGPAGTYSQEAVFAGPGSENYEPVPLPTVHDAVMAVHEGRVQRALVPIENSLEGAVNATLDALAFETDDVQITGELVHPIHHCLIARAVIPLGRIGVVASHPQASGQCATFLRTRLPGAAVLLAASTADAVRLVAEREPGDAAPWAAIGSRAAAALYGCEVLEGDVEDAPGSETRFVWIAREAPPAGAPGPWKTALMFWEPADDRPGWLVRCLAEFADREVNLTRIESRPRREGLGSYMFFVDLEGRAADPAVAEAIDALRAHAAAVRVLGSFPTGP